MGNQHLEDVYELYLLGALSSEEAATIREHVGRQCPQCIEYLREAALSVYFLCLTPRPVRTGAQVKAQLLARLRRRLPVAESK